MATEEVSVTRMIGRRNPFLLGLLTSSPVDLNTYTKKYNRFRKRDVIEKWWQLSLQIEEESLDLRGAIEKWCQSELQIEEYPSDLTVSESQIALRINIGDDRAFRIIPSGQPHDSNLNDLNAILDNLRDFSRQKGYLLQELSGYTMQAALPPPREDVIETQTFECFITSTNDNVAFITLIDKDNEKSYMEIPIAGLIQREIKCQPGTIFSLVFKQQDEWEKAEFIPSKQTQITKKERLDTLKYYEEKYGDL